MCPCCCCQVDRETMKPDSLSEESGSHALRQDCRVIRHAAVHGEAGLEGENSFALTRTPTVGACKAQAVMDHSPAEFVGQSDLRSSDSRLDRSNSQG